MVYCLRSEPHFAKTTSMRPSVVESASSDSCERKSSSFMRAMESPQHVLCGCSFSTHLQTAQRALATDCNMQMWRVCKSFLDVEVSLKFSTDLPQHSCCSSRIMMRISSSTPHNHPKNLNPRLQTISSRPYKAPNSTPHVRIYIYIYICTNNVIPISLHYSSFHVLFHYPTPIAPNPSEPGFPGLSPGFRA